MPEAQKGEVILIQPFQKRLRFGELLFVAARCRIFEFRDDALHPTTHGHVVFDHGLQVRHDPVYALLQLLIGVVIGQRIEDEPDIGLLLSAIRVPRHNPLPTPLIIALDANHRMNQPVDG